VKAPATEQSRDRVLSDEELALVWQGTDDLGWPFGPLFKLLLLTGQRRAEVAAMRWSEVDLVAKLWTLPKERVKNGTEHVVPLSTVAISILERLPRVKGDFVFTVTGTTSVSGFARAKSRIDAFMTARAGQAAAESLPHWTLHDLRRTAASGMARLGISLPTIEKVLNHTSGSFAGIVGVYQRHSFADEKRAALEAWGGYVEGLMNERVSHNILPLKTLGQSSVA
jgi:integrase